MTNCYRWQRNNSSSLDSSARILKLAWDLPAEPWAIIFRIEVINKQTISCIPFMLRQRCKNRCIHISLDSYYYEGIWTTFGDIGTQVTHDVSSKVANPQLRQFCLKIDVKLKLGWGHYVKRKLTPVITQVNRAHGVRSLQKIFVCLKLPQTVSKINLKNKTCYFVLQISTDNRSVKIKV